jgi:hypothetical protein
MRPSIIVLVAVFRSRDASLSLSMRLLMRQGGMCRTPRPGQTPILGRRLRSNQNSCASETWTACIGQSAKPYHPTEFDTHRYAFDGLIGY